ncbi:MAG: amidohydrolase family protein [Steroidobacteraceae bacterium]
MTRRNLVKGSVLGAAALPSLQRSVAAAPVASRTPEAAALYAVIKDLPVDDTHCHPISDADAHTSPGAYIERLALAAFPAPAYFPAGVFEQWQAGDEHTRDALDRRYGISKVLAKIHGHFRETVFFKFMLKEMAAFLGCRPRFEEVIEARNARGRDYFGYVNALFRDAKIQNAMVDTGYADGLDAAGIHRFEAAVRPTRVRLIARVETIQDGLLEQDLSFDALRETFLRRVHDALDGTGNFGRRSYGMKSYLLPTMGLIKPVYDPAAAAASWNGMKRLRGAPSTDREEQARRGKVLQEYLLTLALEACLERDMPMQFHAGDGEAPDVILRNQHPWYLEEFVRFDRDGVMRMPKIIPIHAGYPLVGEAAWLSHLYTNCYFEVSLMTPFIHQGLVHRYLEIMEAVPLSKILFGSDAYNVPELYWLAARWGKRFLSDALAVYVHEGVLTSEEALAAARMILYQNNRAVYRLDEIDGRA